MNVDALIKSRSCLLIVALMALTSVELFLTGCSGELDPARPEDSYRLFRDALFEGNGEAVWERTDEQTREYFDGHYKRLQNMNALIERYLPLTDHQLARQQSGAELLAEVDSGRDFFLHLFAPAEFTEDAAVAYGSDVREVRMSEDGETAVIVTRGETEFMLVRQEDEKWYINLADSGDFLAVAFEWLTKNEDALEQTVEDLIAEELQVREQIIADLMDLDN